MELNLKEMLVGHPIRVRYVQRYSTCRVLAPESVAEHSFFVAFYAMAIVDWCRLVHGHDEIPKILTELNPLTVLRRCILHDLDEAATGDIPRMFKYSDPRLKSLLDDMAAQGFLRVIGGVFDSQFIKSDWLDVWKDAKDTSVNGRIVEFADYLSVIAFTCEEMRSSNFTVQEHVEALEIYAQKFDSPDYDFIRPLVIDAEKILHEEILEKK
jgi:5'-deoxynucleotidase YfbR-like HD superfamily hydrolase